MLDSRKALASGLFPIRVRVTFRVVDKGVKKWIRKYYPTGCSCSVADFPLIMGKSRRTEHEDMRVKVNKVLSSAENVCKGKSFVGVDEFERQLGGPGLTTVAGLFDRVIQDMQAQGRIGTKISYSNSKGSFTEFGGENLALIEINESWLRRYAEWMRTRERSVNTSGIYLRSLRKIFNDAIEQSLISADLYPFGKRRFVIQSQRKKKPSLDEAQKNALLKFKTKDPGIRKAVDFWIFSYFCNGMNMNDILRLRFCDIGDGKLLFQRRKSIRTSAILEKIAVSMRGEVKKIISMHGQKSLDPKEYVFPVLSKGLTPLQERHRITDFIKEVNENLRPVAVKLKLKFKLTTYTARHTFSNISLIKGASKEYIQEALGHQSMETTEIYLAGFDWETKKKMSGML